MFKKVALASLALVMVFMLASMASAKPNVADTTQKGSLLVFPKIAVFPGSDGDASVETYIFIGNDQVTPTWVKCYWMDNNQSVEDFHFFVTANQPVVFSAGEGNYQLVPFSDNASGSLVCWAQDAADQNPQAFNHLYGHAMIQQGSSFVFYNAYSFALRGAPPVYPNSGTLLLDGSVYDACPKYLITNFIAEPRVGPGGDPLSLRPDLTLWPCRQDLRQDRIPTCTKAKFDIWNHDEVKFTGAYQCFKCFFEGFLAEIGSTTSFNYKRGKGYGGEKFKQSILGSSLGRLRVQGIPSTVCSGNTGVPSQRYVCPDSAIVATPLLGVLLYSNAGLTGDGTTSPIYIAPVAGHTLTGAGSDPSGFIKWDPSVNVETKPQN
jgi:hypothetical protein